MEVSAVIGQKLRRILCSLTFGFPLGGRDRSVGRGDRELDPRPALRAPNRRVGEVRSGSAGRRRCSWDRRNGVFRSHGRVPESRSSRAIRSEGAAEEGEKP
jgi:hypothetical protein